MKLHYDKLAFRVLIEKIACQTGFREDVLEKNYYVVLLLSELSQFQKEGLKAYFKGGTALYKALGMTNRFSEDIDISVDTSGCTRTQNDRRLEKATKKYKSLERDSSLGKTQRSSVETVYLYVPIVQTDSNDALQRFGRVKIEAVSFTISEPVAPLLVAPMIYDYADVRDKEVLSLQYGVTPFYVKTMTVERIFIDKLFAAEAYVRHYQEGSHAFDAAKHMYDLVVLSGTKQIRAFLKNEEAIKKMLAIRLEEEKGRLDGINGISPRDFCFFTQAKDIPVIKEAYSRMQSQYVFQEKDQIAWETLQEKLDSLKDTLFAITAWNRSFIRKD